LKEWYAKLKARPAVVAGLNVPEKTKEVTDPKELERIAKENSAWIMQGMAADNK
jgi:hypothetical protein